MTIIETEPCSKDCACRTHLINRRDFLAIGGAATVGGLLSRMPVMAGPLTTPAQAETPDFARLIPPDKNLRPAWVASLFARGEPTVYSKKRGELRYIGMPVGGICCGTVYLGGDGKLWNWDIFNVVQEGVLPRSVAWDGFGGKRDVLPRDGASYVEPHREQSPFDQGFALNVDGHVRPLDITGWDEIAFRGEYPLGIVHYADPACPVAAELTAYSPFIPLDADRSGLPVVLCEFTLTNHGNASVSAEIGGWLQNAARLTTGTTVGGKRRNAAVAVSGATAMQCSFEDAPTEKRDHAPDGDAGTMALMLLGQGTVKATAEPATLFDAPASATAEAAADAKLIGAITAPVSLAPGESKTVAFAVAWHFPNSRLDVKDAAAGNDYAKGFHDAAEVARAIARDYLALRDTTRLWHRTWHDSTLPHWFLERSFINTSILATTTAHRFATGRFWAWEGVGCCPGTCTHVWHYAQAPGRIFPEIERILRERIDLGVAFDHDTGMIGYRGEGTGEATDGQCGRVIGTYREHLMSADAAFLRRVWPNAKKAVQFLMDHDRDGDGLLDGPQDNTLDGTWYGKIAWISSLYAAALRAGEEMATEMGDTEFAALCRQKFLVSKNAIETQLFDGEYFIQIPDPAHTDSLGSYRGCHVDQVQGQSWAWQVGLGRVLDQAKTRSALRSLYTYNFAPDVGRFRAKNTEGRPYALAGDAGLIMVTNPRGLPDPFGVKGWQFQYFNECMTGFEHQVASHMIVEGMVLEGLALTRAIHDRYHASLRNPYNEIECSDHYARAMASYGSFVSICGFAYHGPKGHIAFTPRITPERFKCAFTSAEGWGSYAQAITGKTFMASLAVHHGRLRLTQMAIAPGDAASGSIRATADGKPLPITHRRGEDGRVEVAFAPVVVSAGQALQIVMEAQPPAPNSGGG